MRFLFLIFSFLFVFGSFHSVHAQEADKIFDNTLGETISSKLKNGDRHFYLSELTDFEWDRACVIKPGVMPKSVLQNEITEMTDQLAFADLAIMPAEGIWSLGILNKGELVKFTQSDLGDFTVETKSSDEKPCFPNDEVNFAQRCSYIEFVDGFPKFLANQIYPDSASKAFCFEETVNYKKHLFNDLINTAINTDYWNTGYYNNDLNAFDYNFRIFEKEHNILKNRATAVGFFINESQPFFKYAMWNDKLPKHGVINKWELDKIKIGFQFPLAKKTYDLREITDHRIDEIKAAAQKAIPEIEKYTGLKFEVTDGLDAQILILPAAYNRIRNYFKYSRTRHHHDSTIFAYESIIFGKVEFTPKSLSQVDGYLIANDDNSIGMAICRIFPYSEEKMLERLVQECLVRSTGLPGMAKNFNKTILGNWNRAHDAFSLRDTVKRTSEDKVKLSPKYENVSVEKENFPDHYPSELTNWDDVPDGITDYDAAMMKLLYCPVIKSGMDVNEAAYNLYNNEECFNSLFEE